MNNNKVDKKRIYKTLVKKCSKYTNKAEKHSSKNHIHKTENYTNKTNNAISNIETMVLSMSPNEILDLKNSLKKESETKFGKEKEVCLNGLAYLDYFTNCHLTSSYNEVYENEWTQARMRFPKTDWFHYLYDFNFNDKQKSFITDYLLTCEINMFSENMKSEYNRTSPINFFSSIDNLDLLCLKICGPLTQEEDMGLSDSEELKILNLHGEKCPNIKALYDQSANNKLIANNEEYIQFNELLLRIFTDMRNKPFKGTIQTYEYKNIQRYVERKISQSVKALEIAKENIEELKLENQKLELQHQHSHEYEEELSM